MAWPYKLSVTATAHTLPSQPTASPALTVCMRPRQDGDQRAHRPRGFHDLRPHGLTTGPQARPSSSLAPAPAAGRASPWRLRVASCPQRWPREHAHGARGMGWRAASPMKTVLKA